MRDFRVIFMGTPEFSVPCLAALHAATHVLGVVTQPDKPRGRGQKLTASPVKAWAEKNGLPVWQPKKVRETAFVDFLREQNPDLIVVVAFGQILSQDILDIPPLGCINVHASLLPAYRGAALMQWCLMHGEKKTGVTTMFMDAGLDTGDMLLKDEFPLGADTTLEEVHDGLMNLGAKLLIDTLAHIAEGTLTRTPQTGVSSYAPRIEKEMVHIAWDKRAYEIHNLVRAVDPAPGAFTFLNGRKFKIWKTCPLKCRAKEAPGTIVEADKKKGFVVATADDCIEILELQAPGKKRMSAAEYLNGHGILFPAKFEG